MTEDDIIIMLNYPCSQFVDYAISLANLNWKEETAISLCGRKAMTQERAAEKAGYSVDAMQRWYRSGMRKLLDSWSATIFVMDAVKAEKERK